MEYKEEGKLSRKDEGKRTKERTPEEKKEKNEWKITKEMYSQWNI